MLLPVRQNNAHTVIFTVNFRKQVYVKLSDSQPIPQFLPRPYLCSRIRLIADNAEPGE